MVYHKLPRDATLSQQYTALRLPPAPVAPPAPRFGKVQIPRHDFTTHTKHVAQIHFSNKRQVLGIFAWLYASWDVHFAGLCVMDTCPEATLPLPCMLEDFKRLQHKYVY